MPRGPSLQGQIMALFEVQCINSSHRGPGGATRQAAVLRQEGVVVGRGHLGELMIDFGAFGWFPNCLPSEEGQASDSEVEP